jgi:hypothetical protein
VEHFRLKTAGGEPVMRSRLSSHCADVSDRICVIAWQGHRGEKLHLSEDTELMASELNREWPSIEHWAAPATADEIRAHATQAARLMALAA